MILSNHMKTTIKESGLKLSPIDQKDIDRHLAKIKLLVGKFGSSAILNIEVSRVTNHHRKGEIYEATATLVVNKKSIRVETQGEAIGAAFEKCRKELEREIEKYKTGKEEKNYRQARKMKKMNQMSPLAWRGEGREEEQKEETETPIEETVI